MDSRADAQASGDLPVSIEIDFERPGEGDEGTAMLEIIHDIAPNASLAFSGPATSLEMVESVNFLANTAFGGTGADIVVDDLGFFFEPFFEDGIVAQAVQSVVASGTIYVSAAGNDANTHYEGDFVNNGVDLHDFGGGDAAMSVTIPDDETMIAVLQWSDQFGFSGQDYDLIGCTPGSTPETILDTGECFVGTIDVQDGDDDPFEFFIIENEGSSAANVDIFVSGLFADEVRRLEIYILGNITLNEHIVSAGSVFGPYCASLVPASRLDNPPGPAARSRSVSEISRACQAGCPPSRMMPAGAPRASEDPVGMAAGSGGCIDNSPAGGRCFSLPYHHG